MPGRIHLKRWIRSEDQIVCRNNTAAVGVEIAIRRGRLFIDGLAIRILSHLDHIADRRDHIFPGGLGVTHHDRFAGMVHGAVINIDVVDVHHRPGHRLAVLNGGRAKTFEDSGSELDGLGHHGAFTLHFGGGLDLIGVIREHPDGEVIRGRDLDGNGIGFLDVVVMRKADPDAASARGEGVCRRLDGNRRQLAVAHRVEAGHGALVVVSGPD